MSHRSLRRRTLPSLLGGALLTAAALAGAGLAAPTAPAPSVVPSATPRLASGGYTCTGYCQHPTNAAKVFRWGLEAWKNEFEVGKFNRQRWKSDHPKAIGQKGGMLTIRAENSVDSVTTWASDQSARYGRWEARVRLHERPNDTGAQYQGTWMLDPVGDDHCRGSEVTMATYTTGDANVRGWVRTLDSNQFGFSRKKLLSNLAWHTYAVEITPTHISWFTDTKVIHTERRPAALSGVRYRPQFLLTGTPGADMHDTWLQMDWVRFYDLKRKNAKSIKAPQMSKTTYGGAC